MTDHRDYLFPHLVDVFRARRDGGAVFAAYETASPSALGPIRYSPLAFVNYSQERRSFWPQRTRYIIRVRPKKPA